MITCPACGADNEDSAAVCTGCQALLHPPKTDPFAPRAPPASSLAGELSALSLSEAEAAEACSAEARAAAAFPPRGLGTLPPLARGAPPPVAAQAAKTCGACGGSNPVAARFCSDCGTPFAPEDRSAEEPLEPPGFADAFEEALPFAAVVRVHGAEGVATIRLAHFENRIGATGAHVELRDPCVAPHAATLAFVEERLVLRDEGSANGVFLRVRSAAPLHPGDPFVAGERLLRWDGPVELPPADSASLGAPRPEPAYRVVELLEGGRTGRVCLRAGPAISIGRSGCDLTFAGDALLAPRHAEILIEEAGAASLVDLGAGEAGVFVRIPPREAVDLRPGDVLQIGNQLLEIDIR